jgi:hypothetical protein
VIVLALTWTSFLHYATFVLWFVVFWAGLGAIVWYAERRARARPAERKHGGRGWARGDADPETAPEPTPATAFPFRDFVAGFHKWLRRNPLAWPALWLMWRVRLRYGPGAIWDPFNLDAWYYGHASRLRQSLVLLVGYMLQFLVLFALFGMAGCKLFYEMPVGGGGPHQTIAQQVQIQKVIRKKFVINPLSSIIFNPPPIEEVKLELKELTQNRYEVGGGNAPGVGSGEGDAAGYGAGTRFGRVRFIRIRYDGGDWDQDMGVGADLNMLVEYGLRTRQKVAEATEAVTIEQLGRFDRLYSPPFVYLTGAGSISVGRSQVKTLRDYVLKHHGMIFADNGGTAHWHNQFIALMRQVLPDVREVAVPLDDPIHRVPYAIASLPYVAPHGGTEALGWKVQGRWVAYYHPGDIGDAWKDDHAGVPADVVEACYRLGVNVIHYSHAEYSQWVLSQRK